MEPERPPVDPRTSVDPRSITRPDPVLRTYYIICAFMTLPAVVITLPLLMFKYKSLRYRFDDDGIAMSWGILFRREMYLTYRRIQDIHVTRGIIQRWLGIATISVQTASGGGGSDMQIEGIVEYDTLRDFLYRRMRGAHGEAEIAASGASKTGEAGSIRDGARADGIGGAVAGGTGAGGAGAGGAPDDALALLREIRDEIRRLQPSGGARP